MHNQMEHHSTLWTYQGMYHEYLQQPDNFIQTCSSCHKIIFLPDSCTQYFLFEWFLNPHQNPVYCNCTCFEPTSLIAAKSLATDCFITSSVGYSISNSLQLFTVSTTNQMELRLVPVIFHCRVMHHKNSLVHI